MRIAFISQYFYPEQFSNNFIAKALVEMGHEVDVITCVPNYPEGVFFDGYSNHSRRTEVWNGVRIHRARTIARGKKAIQLIANFLGFVFFGILLARKVARSKKPDVSFVSMPSPVFQALVGIYLKRRYGVPLVYWVQDIWPESATFTLGLHNPLIVKPLTKLCGWIYRQADLILVQSSGFPPMIERFGVTLEKIRVFPNSAPEIYRPVRPEEAPEEGKLVPQNGFRLMFAGNIGESQDFDTLIKAAKLLKGRCNVTWVILGSGRDQDRVMQRISEIGLEDCFLFLGRYPAERMPFFFAHADAMLISLKRSDIFALTVPYKIQSYMACGKPIIVSAEGESARLIEEAQAGLTSPPESPQNLAETIETMVKTFPQKGAFYAANSRAYFEENYVEAKLNKQLETWLSDTVKPQHTH